jgi:hypothetical protein
MTPSTATGPASWRLRPRGRRPRHDRRATPPTHQIITPAWATQGVSLCLILHPSEGGHVRTVRCRFHCAPMVNQSERAFRMMVRAHGVGVCWSPMVLASEASTCKPPSPQATPNQEAHA